MRFASAGKFSANDYAPAGRSAAQSLVQAFATARQNAPDWTGLAKVSMGTRSAERQAAMKAEADVATAGIKAFGDVKSTQIKGAYDLAAFKTKLKSQKSRMAGRLAGLGGAMGKKPRKKATLTQEQIDAQIGVMRGSLDRMSNQPGFERDEFDPNKLYDGTGATTPASTDSGNSGVQSDGKVTPPVQQQKPSPSTPSGNPTQQQAFNQIYELAKAHGGAKYPEVVAAQAMHETGWLSAPNSVYMSSGKTNPFGQTGDRGYGTIPRKGFKDGWTIYPDLKTAVGDHIKLWHDTANHPGNYNAFENREEAIRNVATAYSPDSDKENIRRGFTVNGYVKGVTGALNTMGL